MKQDKSQSGNVMIFILIAIGLLGLLTVSLSKSSSDSNDTGDYERNQIIASEVLTYAKSIETAVQSLLARGCSENEISFENNEVAGYENPNSPTDKSCHVFDAAGAGINLLSPPKKTRDPLNSLGAAWDYYRFMGQARFEGVGTDGTSIRNTELYMMIALTNEGLCQQINHQLKVSPTTPIPSDAGVGTSTAAYIGVFSTPTQIMGNEAGSINLKGLRTACYLSLTNGTYGFYHILIAR